MTAEKFKCVLLADRHHGLSEGIRGMLETAFQAVVMVADVASLVAAAERLQPNLAVVDISLARGDNLAWLKELHSRFPALKLIVLSVHDEPSAIRAVAEAGADGLVLKRSIASELLLAIEEVLGGGHHFPVIVPATA